MATPKKLSRTEVYKQIDAFRGFAGRSGVGRPSLEEWVAGKQADFKPADFKPLPGRARNVKV